MGPRSDASSPAERPASGRFGRLSLRRMSIRSKFYLAFIALVGGVLLFVAGHYPARLAGEFRRRLILARDGFWIELDTTLPARELRRFVDTLTVY